MGCPCTEQVGVQELAAWREASVGRLTSRRVAGLLCACMALTEACMEKKEYCRFPRQAGHAGSRHGGGMVARGWPCLELA